jgi:Flp pilus assembly protein TadD
MASRQRYTEAEAAFRRALEGSPRYAEAHSNLGAMLERRGMFDQAIGEYQAAIEDKPDFRQAQYQLGHLLLMQKKTADAIAHLSRTLTPEDGDTPRFMYTLGVAYAEASDFTSAERYLQKAGQRAAALGQNDLAERVQMILAKVEQRASR